MSSSWLNQEQERVLHRWWHGLQPVAEDDAQAWSRRKGFHDLGRGDRASLRRCTTPGDVVLQSACARLIFALSEVGRPMLVTEPAACALVAGLIARVDQAAGAAARPFASQLGKPREGGGGPLLSRLRFEQLLAAETEEDLFLRMRRALDMLAGQPIHIVELANDLFGWIDELRGHKPIVATDRVRVRWALSYFGEVSRTSTTVKTET